ncbi:MAG: selenium cofactor biosynthesis protein YqeC [Anaerolineales bacterium]
MDLRNGLRLTRSSQIALVGAGGKTTALFQLAGEYEVTVLATATTHMDLEQLQFADRHVQILTGETIPPLKEEYHGQTLLYTGSVIDGESRVRGVTEPVLSALRKAAITHHLPLLIEADGARQLPLKAPADHEPPIPPFVDTVIVMAGLSGLGKPLREDSVHRPHLFGEVAGLSPGEPIQIQHLKRVLLSSQGGLKNIPPQARKILLLNQADTLESTTELEPLIHDLVGTYQAVGITSLGVNGKVHAVHEPVAGVVLAAGGSERYGRTKQLLPWRGEPLVRHVAKTALATGLDPVIVVTGAEGTEVEKAVADVDVQFIHNPSWALGQSTSLQAGLSALSSQVGCAVFLLADQPQIPAALVRALKETHAKTHAPIIAAKVEGQRANPVIFDRDVFPALMALAGDVGGRVLFDRYPTVYVPWDDTSIRLDVDTPEDYQRLLNQDP